VQDFLPLKKGWTPKKVISQIEQITKKMLEVERQERATGGAGDVDTAPGEKVTVLKAFAKSEVYRILQLW
jgi:hypothetical protein